MIVDGRTIRAAGSTLNRVVPGADDLASMPLAGPGFDVDFLIGGAGPGGGTAAALAAARGARVLVAEARPFQAGAEQAGAAWGQRWQQAIVRSESMGVLERAGVADELFADPASTYRKVGMHGVVALGPLEQALHRSATSQGAAFRFGTRVEDFTPIEGGGALVQLSDGSTVRARTYVDATGGRSDFLPRYGIGLGPARDSQASYFLGLYPTQPVKATASGADFVRGSGPVRASYWHPDHGQYSLTVLNHPTNGAHVDIHLNTRPATSDPAELRRIHQTLAAAAGVKGDAKLQPYIVDVFEREAEHVVGRNPTDGAMLDIVVIGDGIARKRPAQGRGVNGAIVGANEVVAAALETGPSRAAGLERLERSQLRYHHEGMTSHSRQANQLDERRAALARRDAEVLASRARRAQAE